MGSKGLNFAKSLLNAVSRMAQSFAAAVKDFLTSSRSAVDECLEPGDSEPSQTLPRFEVMQADKRNTRTPSSPFLPSVLTIGLGIGVFSVENWPAVLQVLIGVVLLTFGVVKFFQTASTDVTDGWRSASDAKYLGAPHNYFNQVAEALRYLYFGFFNLVLANFLHSTELPLGTVTSAFEHGVGFAALGGLACLAQAIALLCGPVVFYAARYAGKVFVRIAKLRANRANDDVSGPDL